MNRKILKWLRQIVLEMHLQENTLFDLGVQNVAQYTLHPVTYAQVKFKVATTKGLEENALTRNTLFDLGVKVTENFAQYPL